ncbi:toxin-antitoxin system HicB family antitoxin [Solicola sp. PLA-1-18]|uniref:toxin-antitoxin system HicB family antitoxin n=1 Tax=Solicola sp. PLA-1-18 TaxID=3380532 RepID=UPI003B7878B7
MDLTRYVERLRSDLTDVAAAAGPDAADAAQRLALALEPAFRMSLMEALSDAADEITADLGQARVEVRLRGRDPQLVVHDDTPPLPPPPPTPPEPPEAPQEEDGSVARVTVRIPEQLKQRAEEIAAETSQSLNTFVVQAVRAATTGRRFDIDLGSMRFTSHGPPGSGSRRIQGWSR